MMLRTFIVSTPELDRLGFREEVDGRGDTPAEALADARREAADLYGDDFTLVEIEAGGSGGLITWSAS